MNSLSIKLSIITINKNNTEGLRKTIESIQSQTFRAFEHIVVDGASTDGSLEIIQRFENSAIRKYQWISEPDCGVYQAMNKGTRLASGVYLIFLNSGDYLVNKRVLDDVFSKSHSADFLLGRCNISQEGKVIHTTAPPAQITFGYLFNQGISHQSTFIKREVFEKYGLYREDFRYNADIEFWYRTIILNGCSAKSLSTIVSDYNLEGISNKENNCEEYRNEMDEIYAHPFLQRFIPDYEDWKREREQMKIMYWAKSKPVLYLPIKWLFHIASGFHKIRK